MACSDSAPPSSTGSSGSATDWAGEIGPPERFTWDDEPIEFSPPPSDWERQRAQSGGLFGARFVKYESGGQEIHVAEVTSVGRRDRCKEIRELIRDLDSLSGRDFARRLQRARPGRLEPINRSEEEAFETARERLDAARMDFVSGNRDEAESKLSASLWDLEWVEYTLSEVVSSVLFDPENPSRFGKVIEVSEPEEIIVGDQPALQVDYRLESESKGRILVGREIYVEINNRLFEATFLGAAENLPLFDAVVESISFPGGECEH